MKGKRKKALHLNGHGEYVDIVTTGLLNPGKTQYTICAWVLDESVPNGLNAEAVIMAQLDNDGTGRIQMMRTDSQKGTNLNSVVGGHQVEARPGCLQRGQWQHVAVSFDAVAKLITYYVNGKMVASARTSFFESCTGGFRIGGHKQERAFWKGLVDELYVYRGVLDEADINKIMNGK